MSIAMRRVWEVAKKMDESLLATNPGFQNKVLVRHEEGTTLFYENAFAMRYYDKDGVKHCWGNKHPNEWLLVFTEHHGFHVYPLDDLDDWRQFAHSKITNHADYPEPSWECENCHHEFIEPVSADGMQKTTNLCCPLCDSPKFKPYVPDKDEEDAAISV